MNLFITNEYLYFEPKYVYDRNYAHVLTDWLGYTTAKDFRTYNLTKWYVQL